ncbi:MAM domain-containing glycosylphosphatidylinositol anchor protein 1-like [Cynoglossus semilaevis]|uniref:MAM domain-containing glycosylphosphatidylinositol anchor protein 1-like n=1 Tax=Cynoglossus semilaevis TaxID=244447 RepID=UPI0007DCB04D|nr:MAM domain-containing glycosylphosphatidylinositol anchor protein 1-like [Cynoglossus semilaevis]
MELFWILLFSSVCPLTWSQGVYAPASAQIVHSGAACNVKDDNISERIYTIKEGDTLVLHCLVKGHPRPQVRWTKTAGSASEKFQETSIYNETLRIKGIQRVQGGRYYCKADNGVGVAAIKSIRVDVQCKWAGGRWKKERKLSTSRPQLTFTTAVPTLETTKIRRER